MPQLKEAIKRTRISIAILSRDYASSKSCLDGLVQMWERRESDRQIILPIFYHVEPSDVRHQAGDFGKSFNLHEIDRVDSNTIKTWRNALFQIGEMKGWRLERDGSQKEFVEEVAAFVEQMLKEKHHLVVPDMLVGIDHDVQEMMKNLGVAYSEGEAVDVQGELVSIVGIYGAPGVGKTTLAKVVFNNTHELFDACSFLEGISSRGVQLSQQKLIDDLRKQIPAPRESSGEGIEEIGSLCRNAKVLIVLDVVHESEQIRALTGDLTWFGLKSRIIVTTDDISVLNFLYFGPDWWRIVIEYKVEEMDPSEAQILFRRHAFQGDALKDIPECDSLSKEIVKAIGGRPSAIVHHASYLRNKSMEKWKETLDYLKRRPEETV